MKVEVVLELEVDLLDVSVRDIKKLVDNIISSEKPDAIKSVGVKDVKLNP
ncbi:MAG: hypothetical protein ACLFPV_06420 [Spirochaetaceae bacterium]